MALIPLYWQTHHEMSWFQYLGHGGRGKESIFKMDFIRRGLGNENFQPYLQKQSEHPEYITRQSWTVLTEI